ncbi:hypothetical protein CN918_29155 [Priestia megaterium]|nr:hypothetical protein CN918_29155 [Priestia megaterium]
MPYRKFEYKLLDKNGHFIDVIKSPVTIYKGNKIALKGQILSVVDKQSDSSLTVDLDGDIIVVE